jgi:hypothetical protein
MAFYPNVFQQNFGRSKILGDIKKDFMDMKDLEDMKNPHVET